MRLYMLRMLSAFLQLPRISVYLYLSPPLTSYLSRTVCSCFYISNFFLCLSQCKSVCLSLNSHLSLLLFACLPLSICISISHSIFPCFFLYLCVTHSVSLSVSYLSLTLCLSISV